MKIFTFKCKDLFNKSFCKQNLIKVYDFLSNADNMCINFIIKYFPTDACKIVIIIKKHKFKTNRTSAICLLVRF